MTFLGGILVINMTNIFSFKNIIGEHFAIQALVGGYAIDIYRFDIIPQSGKIVYYTSGLKGEIVSKIIKEGDPWEPWIRLGLNHTEVLSDLLDALLEFGVMPKKHTIDGDERTAIQYHLEDMRRLVFSTSKTTVVGNVSKITVDSCTSFEGHDYDKITGICKNCGDANGIKIK